MMPARPERLLLVADQQQVGLEVEHLAVQQRELLAGAREAHDDGAVEQAIVVRVQRLAELEHHVVGDVDDGGDRADAAALEALASSMPASARVRIDAFDRTRDTKRGQAAGSSTRTSRVARRASPASRRSAAA